MVQYPALQMQPFKTRAFARWASGEGLNDGALASAVAEIHQGLIDARMGGHVVKKRVALPGRGKRGSVRTLIAFKRSDRAFFIFGFAKNERGNVSERERKALRMLAKELLNLADSALKKAIEAGELIEIKANCSD